MLQAFEDLLASNTFNKVVNVWGIRKGGKTAILKQVSNLCNKQCNFFLQYVKRLLDSGLPLTEIYFMNLEKIGYVTRVTTKIKFVKDEIK